LVISKDFIEVITRAIVTFEYTTAKLNTTMTNFDFQLASYPNLELFTWELVLPIRELEEIDWELLDSEKSKDFTEVSKL